MWLVCTLGVQDSEEGVSGSTFSGDRRDTLPSESAIAAR